MLSANAVAHTRPPLQHVTIFGDSEAAALDWDSQARTPLENANRVTYALHPCGRLTTPGCINPPPPSTLSAVRSLGRGIGLVGGLNVAFKLRVDLRQNRGKITRDLKRPAIASGTLVFDLL